MIKTTNPIGDISPNKDCDTFQKKAKYAEINNIIKDLFKSFLFFFIPPFYHLS